MYTGNEKNPVQQIEIIKKNSRQKSSLLDTLIHHALLPMTILFMAIDALTIAYYAQNIFDERVELAWAVSGVLALVLDVSPALAGSLLANHSDLLKSDKCPNKRRICLLMAAAAGAYLVFLVFCIVTAKMNIADVDGDATLYFIGQIARALVPLVTSAAAFGFGWECNHRDRLAALEAERLKLLDLQAETANAIRHKEFAMVNFNADEADYRMACVKLQSLTCAAKSAQLAVRVILANELGSAEAAKALLTRAGLEDPFACDEAKIREMLIPPQADAVPAQPALHLEETAEETPQEEALAS